MIKDWLESAWTATQTTWVVTFALLLSLVLLVMLGMMVAILWRRMRQLKQQVDVLHRRTDERRFEAEDSTALLESTLDYAKSIPKLGLKVTHKSGSRKEIPT